MLASLFPTLLAWLGSPTGLRFVTAPIPQSLRVALGFMGVGVAVSGLRDLYASLQLPGCRWPW